MKKSACFVLVTAFLFPAVFCRAQHVVLKNDSVAVLDSIREWMFRGSLLSMDAMSARYKSKQPDGKGGFVINEQKAGEAQNLFTQSRAFYMKAIELLPGYARAWNNLGSTYYLEGQPEEAVHYCNKAVTLDHDYAAAWYDLGLAYVAMKKEDSAVYSFSNCIRSDSTYLVGYQELSRLYMQQKKDSSAALSLLRKAVQRNPSSEVPWNCISAICFQENDSVKGVAAMEKSAQINPDNYDRLDFLASYFHKHGDASKASYYSTMAEAARVRLYIPPDPDKDAGH